MREVYNVSLIVYDQNHKQLKAETNKQSKRNSFAGLSNHGLPSKFLIIQTQEQRTLALGQKPDQCLDLLGPRPKNGFYVFSGWKQSKVEYNFATRENYKKFKSYWNPASLIYLHIVHNGTVK